MRCMTHLGPGLGLVRAAHALGVVCFAVILLNGLLIGEHGRGLQRALRPPRHGSQHPANCAHRGLGHALVRARCA